MCVWEGGGGREVVVGRLRVREGCKYLYSLVCLTQGTI